MKKPGCGDGTVCNSDVTGAELVIKDTQPSMDVLVVSTLEDWQVDVESAGMSSCVGSCSLDCEVCASKSHLESFLELGNGEGVLLRQVLLHCISRIFSRDDAVKRLCVHKLEMQQHRRH